MYYATLHYIVDYVEYKAILYNVQYTTVTFQILYKILCIETYVRTTNIVRAMFLIILFT